MLLVLVPQIFSSVGPCKVVQNEILFHIKSNSLWLLVLNNFEDLAQFCQKIKKNLSKHLTTDQNAIGTNLLKDQLMKSSEHFKMKWVQICQQISWWKLVNRSEWFSTNLPENCWKKIVNRSKWFGTNLPKDQLIKDCQQIKTESIQPCQKFNW